MIEVFENNNGVTVRYVDSEGRESSAVVVGATKSEVEERASEIAEKNNLSEKARNNAEER